MTGYILDMKPEGFGIVSLGFDAVAAHAPPTTDSLYIVLTADDEPSSVYLPLPSTAPAVIDGERIHQFEGDPDSLMVYRWRSKLFRPRRVAPMVCRVEADDFDNLIVRGYGDGDLHFEQLVSNETEFTLPANEDFSWYQFELLGTSRVRSVQVAEDVDEIA